jgi:long-chain acyl-CoA synthetase
MMTSMRAGASLYPVAKFERRAVAELIEKQRVSIYIAVPFMFSMLAQSKFHRLPDLSSLRLVISSSAPMPTKHNQQFYERFGRYVRQLYGSTETGTISVNLTEDVEQSLDSVGMPIAGVEVGVFTEDGRAAEVGEMGEFAVKSPAAITGYTGLGDLNKEVFGNGYFFTGDLGTKDDDGLLYLAGRKKFFINKAGFKIDPRELEELLESCPKVEEAVVVGVPTAYGDEKVKAVIVSNAPCTEQDIVEYCRGKIAHFKIPSLVEFRDSLPKSPTGKIRRGMLTQ